MQTVQSLASSSWGKSSKGATTSGQTPSSTGASSGDLGIQASGGSAIGALAKYAMTLQAAAGLQNQARDEEMASRQEYVVAQEKANAINAQYGQFAGDQMAVAAANGLDLSSGSVTEARMSARSDADRETGIARRSAETNAALRRARAVTLRKQSSATRLLGLANLAADGAEIGGKAMMMMGGGGG